MVFLYTLHNKLVERYWSIIYISIKKTFILNVLIYQSQTRQNKSKVTNHFTLFHSVFLFVDNERVFQNPVERNNYRGQRTIVPTFLFQTSMNNATRHDNLITRVVCFRGITRGTILSILDHISAVIRRWSHLSLAR